MPLVRYLRLPYMLRPGTVMLVVTRAAFALVARYYWPLIGMTLAAPS